MAAAPTGIAFLAVSFASTSEMMSFGSLSRMSGALRISRLISESYIPAINTSFTIDWVKSHRSRQELLVYPQVSAFPCTLAANVLNVSSRLCLICISSDLRTPGATAITARRFIVARRISVGPLTISLSILSIASPSSFSAH